MASITPLKVLSQQEMQQIHAASMELLAKLGVNITQPVMQELLAAAGATVDKTKNRVYFPKELVEESLKKVPREFVLAAREKQYDLAFPHPGHSFYAQSGTGMQNIIDFDTNSCRYVERKDVEQWVRLIHKLERIDICSLPSPIDTPEKTRDVHLLAIALQHTTKHIMVQPYSSQSIPYLCELAVLAAGGKESLRQNPVISIVTCSIAPLSYKDFDVDLIIAAGEYGIPLHVASLTSASGSGPITVAGSIAQSNAEILAGIVMVQTVCPGLPVIGVTIQLPLNMTNGIALQSSAEAALGDNAGIQMLQDYYHLPARTQGFGSDSLYGDSQMIQDNTFIHMATALAGTDILIGAGSLECLNTISLPKLVADNEMIGMMKHYTQGVLVNEDTLAVDAIREVLADGSSYIVLDHTLEHCRDAYLPQIMDRKGRMGDSEAGFAPNGELLDRAKKIALDILSSAPEPKLAPDIQAGIENILAKADAALT